MPLSPDKNVAFIGKYAKAPRYQGGGSSHINSYKVESALDAVEFAQNVCKERIVVLHNGAPVEMPWLNQVKGVLEAYLGGQAVGGAVVNVLYGNVNPSGRLAETFPLRLQNTPCYLTFGGEHDKSVYAEGIFVGYRYYTSKDMRVLFPFGHGLSYTTFAYKNLSVDKEAINESESLNISVDMTNTGTRFGKKVIQIYVAPKGGTVIRPVRELRAFDKIGLNPGETKTVTFLLDRRAFAYWNTEIHDWHVESGEYEIQIGENAQDIVLSSTVTVNSVTDIPKVYTRNSTMGEILADPKGKEIFQKAMAQMLGDNAQLIAAQEDNSGASHGFPILFPSPFVMRIRRKRYKEAAVFSLFMLTRSQRAFRNIAYVFSTGSPIAGRFGSITLKIIQR